MKYISYMFNILLFGSLFYLGLTQQTNQNVSNQMKIIETTTAEPKRGVTTTTVKNLLLLQTSSTTSIGLKTINNTTPLYDVNKATNSIYSTQSVKATIENSHHSTHTTAIPVIVTTAKSDEQQEFHILSFMGGCLFTLCIMAIGTVLWKAYKMKIERNYRTI